MSLRWATPLLVALTLLLSPSTTRATAEPQDCKITSPAEGWPGGVPGHNTRLHRTASYGRFRLAVDARPRWYRMSVCGHAPNDAALGTTPSSTT